MMKKILYALSFVLLLGSVVHNVNDSFVREPAAQFAFSESMILNSSAFNLHSAIQESLLDRESPEYILLS